MKEKEVWYLSLEKENKLRLLTIGDFLNEQYQLPKDKGSIKGIEFGTLKQVIDWLKNKRRIGKRVIIIW